MQPPPDIWIRILPSRDERCYTDRMHVIPRLFHAVHPTDGDASLFLLWIARCCDSKAHTPAPSTSSGTANLALSRELTIEIITAATFAAVDRTFASIGLYPQPTVAATRQRKHRPIRTASPPDRITHSHIP